MRNIIFDLMMSGSLMFAMGALIQKLRPSPFEAELNRALEKFLDGI